MAAKSRVHVVMAVIVAQCAAILGSGLMWRPTNYIHNTPLAEWTFATFPEKVNPDPEIFIERGTHSEASINLRTTHVFRDEGAPIKMVRHWTNSHASAGLCPEGFQVSARNVVEVDRGWQYLNGPLACAQASGYEDTQMRLGFAGTGEWRAALDTGWADTEAAGTWTNALGSAIQIRIPPGREARGLYFSGHYFARVRTSEVRINGQPIGRHSLGNTQLEIPPGVAGDELVIELYHRDAASPAQLGQSSDTRLLAYYLNEVQVRLRFRRQTEGATRQVEHVAVITRPSRAH